MSEDQITAADLVANAADEVASALRASPWVNGVSTPVQGYGDAHKLMFISEAGDVFEVEVSRALKPAERR